MTISRAFLQQEPIRWDLPTGEHDRCPECGNQGLSAPRRRERACSACGTSFTLPVPPNRWARVRDKNGVYEGPAVIVRRLRGDAPLVALFQQGAELAKRHARRGEYEILVGQILEALATVDE